MRNNAIQNIDDIEHPVYLFFSFEFPFKCTYYYLLRNKLKGIEYRGEQAEMNIQRLNVRIDQVLSVLNT